MPRVLVVDDDAVTRELVGMKIVTCGAEVVEASDGAKAYAALQTGSFDLIIADLEMPAVNGFELLGCIRSTPSLAHVPVVILTGKEDRRSMESALAAGATSYLVKPLNWLTFGAHIKHLLSVGRAPGTMGNCIVGSASAA